jgi:hypothetical protein
MSHNYGLISKVDAKVLEKTIDLVCDEFPRGVITICEIGVYAGETGNGIREYIKSKGRESFIIGIDNNMDGEKIRFEYDKLIIGNSNEVYNQLENWNQYIILLDGCHSFPAVISDFFCYKSKLAKGGYMCFHDAAPQAQGKDWQKMGSPEDRDMHISVTNAISNIGLFAPRIAEALGWRQMFWEWDEKDECGGFFVIKKLY